MPYTRITRAELRLRLQERWDSSPWWTLDDANQALDDALLYWNALTGYWRRRQTLTIPANDPFGVIADTMVQNTSVSINGVPLTKGSLAGLSLSRPNWRRESVATAGCPSVPVIWAPVSLSVFVIWPATAVDVTASVDGVRSTPRLTSDADFLDADDSVVSTFVGYALHLAALKAPAGVLERTAGYKDDFLLEAADRNQALRRTDWYKRIQSSSRQHLLQPVKRAAPDQTGGPGQR